MTRTINTTTQEVDASKYEMLSFPRTDGDSSRRPPNVDPTVRNGEVNYHRVVGLEEGVSVSWRAKVGAAIAKIRGMEGIEMLYYTYSISCSSR
jgi:hypothetical protein